MLLTEDSQHLNTSQRVGYNITLKKNFITLRFWEKIKQQKYKIALKVNVHWQHLWNNFCHHNIQKNMSLSFLLFKASGMLHYCNISVKKQEQNFNFLCSINITPQMLLTEPNLNFQHAGKLRNLPRALWK